MRVLGTGRLRRKAAQIKRRFSNRALILMYHRVAELGCDPWELSVRPEYFAEHLEVLQDFGRLMRTDELATSLEQDKLPRRAVVITFDDGYRDNLLAAKPLLEKYDAPATVFITTGCVGNAREFWWDELEKLCLQPGQLPGLLRLSVNGRTYEWNLEEACDYTEAAYQSNRHWRAWQGNKASARQVLYLSLWELMNPLPDGERQQVRDDLLAWAGAGGSARVSHRSLTPEEVLTLADGGLVEVGCHTVTHPKLAALPADIQLEEIRQSKARLEELLGREVLSFAYPYGRRSDYTNETINIVREAGFKSACTTSKGILSRRANRFELPRFQAPNVDGDAFARQLRDWFNSDS
jgi:peptidoglycan/xylan/chitin deacetylase (PgdA/CDA1 family)